MLLLHLSIAACSWKPVRVFQKISDPGEISLRRAYEGPCRESEDYIPWSGETGTAPMRTIRVNFHFMNNADSTKNLTGKAAVGFAQDLIESANYDLANNQSMRLPLHNNTAVLDPLIRYELVFKKEGSPAIYQHFDDEHYYLVKKGPYQNNYDRTVIDKYGIGLDTILNVFVQVPPPDSLITADYGGLKTGVALRNGIRISGPLLEDARVWSYTGMFNHEVGHILGLRHSWVRDQCDDTPVHPNCWNFTYDGSVCDSLVSNNVMDSNADQDAWTPCQIGIMQRCLTEGRQYQRSFIKADFCNKQSTEPIRIVDTVVWCRETDVTTDIWIARNSQLVIANRVSIPQNGRILIEKGGQLVLRKTARIENACGEEWAGIYSKKPDDSQVIVEDGAILIKIDHRP